ncbi:DUF456 domain-containing protein [Flavobacterium crassostreae]|uniref:DUF456 domain-containing protein n=1 Tax=Flavobacterium crassostreae TaxID=1763534 RepID=A0A1B9E970_9FLAO|nr:DUF456 domain-containing protein [Flavobacterium crassostreae]OCB78486.1 hypothetical protein LPBF_02180 [Flavobacterium crassostreae]
MDLVFLIIGLVLMLIGILGSVLPVLPGLFFSWLGLLLLYFTKAVPVDYWVIGSTLVITLVLSILDYIIPAQGTKRFGGSKYGIWGTNIGLVLGIILPIPFGVIIGPFLGALTGELLFNNASSKKAFKAATGSFLGFLGSSFIQLLATVLFLGLYILIAWKYKEQF